MDERALRCLVERLSQGPVVLAVVLDTRGAVPRQRGAMMLIDARDEDLSIGGGLAEARVIEAARAMLRAGETTRELRIDLSGGPDAAGVCGGAMRLSLRVWSGAEDLALARDLASTLRSGQSTALPAAMLGDARDLMLTPDARLLIAGAGHCGLALYEIASLLDFDIWVFDPRASCFEGDLYRRATRLQGEHALLTRALDTPRPVFAVLLNRDYGSDVATLRVLATRPPAFIGMMGSRRRIGEVLAALPEAREALTALHAPVGLEIAAQTPHEIAVSIAAQLIERRAALLSR